MEKIQGRHTPLRRSLWIVGTYLLVGWVWITFSDFLVQQWFPDPDIQNRVHTYKGTFFVLVTGLALFLLLIQQFTIDRRLLSLYRHQRKEIRELNQIHENVIERANVWISVLDAKDRIVLWNKAAEHISGYHREAVIGSDEVWLMLYPDEEYRARVRKRGNETLRDEGDAVGYETRITTRDGRERQLSWNACNLRNDAGELEGYIAIGHDITDIRQAEDIVRRRDRQLSTIMDNLPGMAYRCRYDEFWTMLSVSNGCRELTGYEPDELVNNRLVGYGDLIDEASNEAILRTVESAICNAEPFSIEYQLTRKDGRKIWVWERGRGVEGNDELVLEGIVLDISDRKALEEELAELASRDSLTGMLNRREMNRILEDEISRAKRYDRELALLWIDFDRFKTINDGHGHAAGDSVLKAAIALLAGSVRSVDAVGRFGGEEFVLLLPEMGRREALETAERLRKLVSDTPQPLGNGNTIALTISIGVSVFPTHGDSADALCAAADRAMYQAKAGGRNQVLLAPLTAEAHNQ